MFQESFFFGGDPNARNLPFDADELQSLAKNKIYFGTSSWKYRGWEGIVYGKYSSEAQFQRESIKEYSETFPCVGVDFTFYDWPKEKQLRDLQYRTPSDFQFCFKVTEKITLPKFSGLARYGKWANKENPYHLDAAAFEELFLKPMQFLGPQIGAIFFEFSELEKEHLPKLKEFFQKIPTGYNYGIEFRNPNLVSVAFYQWLRKLGVNPIFNSWTKMPEVKVQWKCFLEAGAGIAEKPLFLRGLLRPGRSYTEAVQMFQPYKNLGQSFPEFRQQVSEIVDWAKKNKRSSYFLINNRLEGCSPETIAGILNQSKKANLS